MSTHQHVERIPPHPHGSGNIMEERVETLPEPEEEEECCELLYSRDDLTITLMTHSSCGCQYKNSLLEISEWVSVGLLGPCQLLRSNLQLMSGGEKVECDYWNVANVPGDGPTTLLPCKQH